MRCDENEHLTPELGRLGEAVSNLSKDAPPADLVSRTLAKISAQYKPVKHVFWMLRPITHPLARVAAAAVIIMSFAPMMDMKIADPLGAQIESRIIGRAAADRVESFLDQVLVREGNTYSQNDLDAVIGIPRPVFKPMRRVSLNTARAKGV